MEIKPSAWLIKWEVMKTAITNPVQSRISRAEIWENLIAIFTDIFPLYRLDVLPRLSGHQGKCD